MLRPTRPISSPASNRGAPLLRILAASAGVCALLYGSRLHAQGAPPPQPGGPAPIVAPQPAPPGGVPTTAPPPAGQPTAMPPQPPPAGATSVQAPYPYPPPQGYGYPPQQQQPYGPYPQSPYGGPPPYYGQPYFYEQPPPPPPPTMRNNATMMGIGIAMVSVGSVGFLSGLAALASANNRVDIYCDGGSRCGSRDDTSLQAVGGALMIVSGVVTIAGIPLWVIGGRRIPLKTDQAQPDKSAKASLPAPVLHVGPRSASLSFTF